MSIGLIIGLLIVGICAGYLSGLVGVGGGIVIVPALVYIFGYSQHLSQGTTLALMIPPIGIFAAVEYYRKGFVDIRVAAIIIAGFLVGSFLGSKLAIGLPDHTIRKIFAILMIGIAVKMLFFTKGN
ncbi:MAG TPA: sulfite exporter TauE/SafE family protein [Chitinophagaceae bacterium]